MRMGTISRNGVIGMTLGAAGKMLLGNLIYLIALFALQFYLCGKQNKWLGLLLPGVFFLYSLYLLAQMFLLHALPDYGVMLRIFVAFISPNINTVILLLIYYFSRKKA